MRQSLRRISIQERAPSRPRKIPDYLKEDLKTAFSIYADIESDGITFAEARSVLWNFGFWGMTRKDFEGELAESKINPSRNKVTFEEILDIVTRKYNNGGRSDRIKDIFNILSPENHSESDVQTIFQAFSQHLEIPITESELSDIFESSDYMPPSNITLSDMINA